MLTSLNWPNKSKMKRHKGAQVKQIKLQWIQLTEDWQIQAETGRYLHVHAPVILVVLLFAWRGHYGRVGDPCRMHAWWSKHQGVREPGAGKIKYRWRTEGVSSERCCGPNAKRMLKQEQESTESLLAGYQESRRGFTLLGRAHQKSQLLKIKLSKASWLTKYVKHV